MFLSLSLFRLMILALLVITECPLATLGVGSWASFRQKPDRPTQIEPVPQVKSRPVASCHLGNEVTRYRVLTKLKRSNDGVMSVAQCVRVGGVGIKVTNREGTTSCELPVPAADLHREGSQGTCYAHPDAHCTGPFIPYDSEGTGSVRVNNGLYISAEDCKRRGGEDFMPFTTTAWGATPKLWEGCLKLSEVTPSRYFNLRDANFQINGLCFGKPES